MIQLYTVSCVYHALSPSLAGKKVMRVIDHCNVYLLVFGTYLPVALLGVGGSEGWILLGVVFYMTSSAQRRGLSEADLEAGVFGSHT